METAQEFAARYAAAWNESDAEARRAAIAALWRPDGAHFVNEREARGLAALEQRIIGSYEKSVRLKGNRFRARPGAQRLRDVVTFFWEMVPAGADTVLAVGLQFCLLDVEGRIVTDYQFSIA